MVHLKHSWTLPRAPVLVVLILILVTMACGEATDSAPMATNATQESAEVASVTSTPKLPADTQVAPTDPPAPPTHTPIQPTNTPARAQESASPTAPAEAIRQAALVVNVTDGDTIGVSIGGRAFAVRYIGMDAPEVDRPLGREARQANQELVEGQTVYLEEDVSETDQYGRLLRYIYMADGTFVNAKLVRQGWASAKEYPPDTKYHDLLAKAEQKAKESKRGI